MRQQLAAAEKTLSSSGIDVAVEVQALGQVQLWKERKNGRSFSANDHLKAMVLALLSSNRPWSAIQKNLASLDSIFLNYDTQQYGNNFDPAKTVADLKALKLGSLPLSNQMASLPYNAKVIMASASLQNGEIEKFVESAPPHVIVSELGSGSGVYRLEQFGVSLAAEYLKNVGIPTFKPDRHILRLFDSGHMNLLSPNATPLKALMTLNAMANDNKIDPVYADNVFWLFGSKICTKLKPKCGTCHVGAQGLCKAVPHNPTTASQNTAPPISHSTCIAVPLDISFLISTANLTLISSGSMMTIKDEPVRMSISINGTKTKSVELHFHAKIHPEGLSLDRQHSADSSVETWHIYDSNNGVSGRTVSPVPVVSYDDNGIIKSIYLQLHTTRLQDDGPVKIEYAWWSGVAPNIMISNAFI